ncbi:MAG: BON domain-containing protein [Anaerolineales bacterium]|nr:BON domain-containing protein [Anaerolineales bacterium]
MLPAQIPIADPDEFVRCVDKKQNVDHGQDINPTQRTDAAIKESVYQALWNNSVLLAMEYDGIDVQVNNGVVYLFGHIVNTTSQRLIKNAIQTIPEILTVNDALVLDDQLTNEVAVSLSDLEHTYNCKFFTGVSHGVVSLNGTVRDKNVKILAEKTASSNPNVRAVINNVRIAGTKSQPAVQPFLQPMIGEVIYFLDGVSGIVKQVVINPNNRRVVAMIIQGKFTDPRYKINSFVSGQAQPPEQLVTVPMNTVRYLTRVSGFLYIRSDERKRYSDFDPGILFLPGNDWKPPYPYCSGDVLFPIQYRNASTQLQNDLEEFPFGAIMEDSSMREQFFATDSLGL